MIKFLDLRQQYAGIRDEIDEAISKVLESTAFIGGNVVTMFEDAFAAYQGATNCVGVGNGTDALEIAIEALDLAPDSEVIVPANSFVASSEAVTRQGLTPVFCDVSESDYLADFDDVERKISSKTSALMVVHLYGQPCHMTRAVELAERFSLRLIEDCAQAHGAEFEGQRVGSFGDIGTFSFYPGKNLGAYGDGGAIVTNDNAIAKRCRMIANHGRAQKYSHEFEGRNSRLDAIQAAVLQVKLRHLDDWIERRQAVARIYEQELEGADAVSLPLVHGNRRHAFHLYVIRTPFREALREVLSAAEIQTGVHYPIALPKQEAYVRRGYDAAHAPVACSIDDHLLSLPIGDHMTTQDALTVVATVKSSRL